MHAAEVELDRSNLENKATMIEAYRKDQEEHIAEMSENQKALKIREYNRKLDDLIETAQEMNRREREAQNIASELHRQISSVLAENKVMGKLIDDKIHEEQVMALELEGERRGVHVTNIESPRGGGSRIRSVN